MFVYGQTGSGKSYTMMGPNEELKGFCSHPELKGLIPRIIEDTFNKVENSDPDIEFTIQVSYIEIYLEKIRDLLDRMFIRFCLVLTHSSIPTKFKD